MLAHDKRTRDAVGSPVRRLPLERVKVVRGWMPSGGDGSGRKLFRLERALDDFAPRLMALASHPVTRADVTRVHDPAYVDGVFEGPAPSQPPEVAVPTGAALLEELGACVTAARAALDDGVAAALTRGAHDAFWDSPGRYWPFNGWMVAASRLLRDGRVRRVAIVDASPHCGSGTQSIIDRLGMGSRIKLVSFGKRFQFRRQAQLYLARVRMVESELAAFQPDLLLYQAAAGSHVLGPVGGVLGTDQMRRRDATVFAMARRLEIPVAWNIDGETPPAPPVEIAVEVHLNTFREAWRTFATAPLE